MATVVSLYILANISYLIVLPLNVLKQTDTIALVLDPTWRIFLVCKKSTDFRRITESNYSVDREKFSSAALLLCHV